MTMATTSHDVRSRLEPSDVSGAGAPRSVAVTVRAVSRRTGSDVSGSASRRGSVVDEIEYLRDSGLPQVRPQRLGVRGTLSFAQRSFDRSDELLRAVRS